MSTNAFFKNIPGIGFLYSDHVFFEYEGNPVIFICKDENGEIYLCLYRRLPDREKWIITETDMNSVGNLINGKKDLRSAFSESSSVIMVITSGPDFSESFMTIRSGKIDGSLLPKEGVCLRCDVINPEEYAKELGVG